MKKWTQEEITLLHEMREQCKGWSEIAATLGRSRKAVEHKVYGKPIPQATHRGKTLTEKELAWLTRHYKHTKNEDIMAKIGISHSSLHRIAREQGLTKSKQFITKMQTQAKDAAYESHKRNRTFPPKGYRIPNSDKGCFKKGHNLKAKLGKKRFAEMQQKRQASWRKTYDSDRRRAIVWGFEQRTKFRFLQQPRSKIAYRYNLRKKGYIEDPDDHNTYYFPNEDMRRPRMETYAAKYGIHFYPLDEDET